MTGIPIPHPERRRALIIVDMQPGFVKERNRWIIPNVQELLRAGGYALVVEAVFHTEKGSIWDRQLEWAFPMRDTVQEIKELLPSGVVRVVKETASAFKGDKDLEKIFRENAIEEVHVAGIDTEDCVFATAKESFDLGFYTYVIEECTESSESDDYRQAALHILGHLKMTNRSVVK